MVQLKHFMLMVLITTCVPVSLTLAAEWKYPRIEGYGKVRPYPDSAVQPESSRNYPILIDVTKSADEPDKVNPAFEHVARLLNLFALSAVPDERIEAVLVVHGPATPAVLNNEHYRQQFGISNPNEDIIGKLARAGVTLYVCGQALAEHEFEPQWVDSRITLALAALTVLPVYQLQGYALVPQ